MAAYTDITSVIGEVIKNLNEIKIKPINELLISNKFTQKK